MRALILSRLSEIFQSSPDEMNGRSVNGSATMGIPTSASVPCVPMTNRTNLRPSHQQQMDGFLYTVFILAFYALTMLYFMLRQICRQVRFLRSHERGRMVNPNKPYHLQEKRSRDRFYRLRFVHSDYAVGKEERMHRAQMKKQLCVHLIKMGQLTQALVSSTYNNNGEIIGDRNTPRPPGRRHEIGSIGGSESICGDEYGQRKLSNNYVRTLQRQARLPTLTRDQSTLTDQNFTTIIDIDSDISEVST